MVTNNWVLTQGNRALARNYLQFDPSSPAKLRAVEMGRDMFSRTQSVMRVAVVGILLAAALGSALASAPRIYVTFRGKTLKFAKAAMPYRSQRTVMVPFREIGAMIGAKISRGQDGKHVEL